MKITVWYLLVICLIKVKEMVNYIFATTTTITTTTIIIVFLLLQYLLTASYSGVQTLLGSST